MARRPNKYFGLGRKTWRSREIDPDEVLIDSSNLPAYDTARFEGRLEKPISRTSLYFVLVFFGILVSIFLFQSGKMQIVKGEEFKHKSENNMLRPVPIFAGRGVIYDRSGNLLVWNEPGTGDVAIRQYSTSTGLSHLLGYVQYPSKDSNGFYYRDDFEGVSGVEKYFDQELKGTSGSRLVEVDARGNIISENTVEPSKSGENLHLSIDERVQSALFKNIKDIADRVGFVGGAGVIMNVNTGEILAMTSYPEFSSQVMSDRTDANAIRTLLNSKNNPFLNRALDGLYTPGSIMKPYIALAGLNEKIIEANTVIHTTGSVSIPNPYDSTKATVFRDWKNHGAVDMRKALAVSSDVYFYTIGGGYKDQKGMGIVTIDKYLKMFGFGTTTLDSSKSFLLTKAGTIPTPEWKKKTFNENWYLGDTYNSSIGQYGFQVTPIQMVRAVASLANGGVIITPSIIKDSAAHIESTVDLPDRYFEVIREGMRMSVTQGTGVALNVPYVEIAAKSGTAELGVSKDKVNSWITGFWPAENPKYAFAVILEKGSVHNLIGAAAATRQQLDWMRDNAPEYFK